MLHLLTCVALAVVGASAATLPRLEAERERPLQAKALQHSLVQQELQAWKEEGHPDFIQFPDDNEQPAWAAVVGSQPKLSDEYGDDVVFHLFTQQCVPYRRLLPCLSWLDRFLPHTEKANSESEAKEPRAHGRVCCFSFKLTLFCDTFQSAFRKLAILEQVSK